jgi:hypothetical protein
VDGAILCMAKVSVIAKSHLLAFDRSIFSDGDVKNRKGEHLKSPGTHTSAQDRSFQGIALVTGKHCKTDCCADGEHGPLLMHMFTS